MEVVGCGGQCCAVFPFPTSPREIWEKIELHGQYNGLDGPMIANMLIPLAHDEAKERCEQFGINPEYVDQYEAAGLKGYTCKHWNEEERTCGAYEARPDMCATYPYGSACDHCGVVGGCENGSGWRTTGCPDRPQS